MFEAIKEMKQAGLNNTAIAWEMVGAVSVFAVPIALLFISAAFE